LFDKGELEVNICSQDSKTVPDTLASGHIILQQK